MATSALSTSNAIEKLTAAFVEGASADSSIKNQTWVDTFDVRTDKTGAIIAAPMTGIANFSSWNKSATITPSSMEALTPRTITYTAFAGKFNFDPFTPDEIQGYEEGVMWQLGHATANTIASAAASIKADAFTTNGLSHGNKPLFATDHEQLAALSSTRSNKIASLFDRSAYLASRAGSQTWQNYQGQVTPWDSAGYTVECHPNSEEAVFQAIRSPVTSGQNQANLAALDNVQFCVNPFLDSEDDVIVHTRIQQRKPFLMWERMAPQMYFDTENGGAIRSVTLVFGYAFSTKGVPDGAFGISAT